MSTHLQIMEIFLFICAILIAVINAISMRIAEIFWRIKTWCAQTLYRTPSRRFFSYAILGIVLSVGIFGAVAPASAQGFLTDIGNGMLQFVTVAILAIARLFIGLTVFSLKFFIAIAQYNGYIDADTVTVGWVMVRDVANMFFVVVLLVIAFATILGIENYEWKKLLVKLLLAAIFINFSKTIAGIIIDAAHIFTITFLNAISGTAGGNLINMFKLTEILSLVGKDYSAGSDLGIEIFGAAVLAIFFASVAMMAMGAYTIVMLARMVVLWVLIVLSPLAYLMQVIPATQSYAQQWWDKFIKQVLVAPVMVFFLWLSFATLGSGNITATLGIQIDGAEADKIINQGGFDGQSISIAEVSTWENMANFFIATAFLMVGIYAVQQMGVVGGGLVGGAIDFGKKVATIAAGITVARGIGERGKSGAIAAAKFGLYKVPFVGGEKWERGAKRLGHRIQRWATSPEKATPLTPAWFARGIMRAEAAGKKKLHRAEQISKTQEDLLDKMSTSGTLGELYRQRKGQLMAYEERSKHRNASSEQAEFTKALGEERMQIRPLLEYLPFLRTDTGEKQRLPFGMELGGKMLGKGATMAEEIAMYKTQKEAEDSKYSTVLGKAEQDLFDLAKPGIAKIKGFQDQVDVVDRDIEKETDPDKKAQLEEKKTAIQQQIQDTRTEMEKNDKIKSAVSVIEEKLKAEAQKFSLEEAQGVLRGNMIDARKDLGDLFSDIQSYEFGKKAAESFIDGIKEKKLQNLFKKATADLDKLKKGEVKKEEMSNVARQIFEETSTEYAKNMADLPKGHAKDLADDIMSKANYGFENPASAMRELIDKRMKSFEGVEREQAVKMGADSLKHLLLIQKENPEEFRPDQEAQMTAIMKYLTKQAWSDDGLARIVDEVQKYDDPKLRSKMSPKEQKEADNLKDVFATQLGWGTLENGKFLATNRSGGDRTNDMQRLAVLGGDVGLLQSENAVLRYQEQKKKGGVELTYDDAARGLAADIKGGNTDHAALLGDAKTAGLELAAFTNRFVNSAADANKAWDAFSQAMQKHAEALQTMADFKNYAVSNAHLDDGGHTIYDMDLGFARGQLTDQAREFINADWRKVSQDKKYQSLKIHTVAEMDEKTGTASKFHRQSWATTFSGEPTQRLLEKLEDRNRRLITKRSGTEEDKRDAKGRLLVGHKDSDIVAKTYSGDENKAMLDIARDWKVALETAPQVLAGLLGERSGIKYDEAVQGKFDFTIGEGTYKKDIKSGEDLIAWINDVVNRNPKGIEHNGEMIESEGISSAQQAAIMNGFKKNTPAKPSTPAAGSAPTAGGPAPSGGGGKGGGGGHKGGRGGKRRKP